MRLSQFIDDVYELRDAAWPTVSEQKRYSINTR